MLDNLIDDEIFFDDIEDINKQIEHFNRKIKEAPNNRYYFSKRRELQHILKHHYLRYV